MVLGGEEAEEEDGGVGDMLKERNTISGQDSLHDCCWKSFIESKYGMLLPLVELM